MEHSSALLSLCFFLRKLARRETEIQTGSAIYFLHTLGECSTKNMLPIYQSFLHWMSDRKDKRSTREYGPDFFRGYIL